MAANKPGSVSAEVLTDVDAIKKEVGLNIQESSLYMDLALDCAKDVAPILVKTSDNKYYLFAKEIERGNFAGAGRSAAIVTKSKVNVVYYASYFTWEAVQNKTPAGAPTPAKALAGVVSADSVTVNPDMPLDKYRGFAETFRTHVKTQAKPARVSVYEVDKQEVADTYAGGRPLAEKTAAEIIDKLSTASSEDKAIIKAHLSKGEGNVFPVLDRLMAASNLTCLLASSLTNIQMLTAVPWQQIKEGVLALYNGKQVFVITPKPFQNPLLKNRKEYDSLRKALDAIIGGAALGVEEKTLPVGLAMEIGLDKVKNATDVFRYWREQSILRDLAYYVIDGHATGFAIGNALAFVDKAIKAGKKVTERDCEKEFLNQIDVFRRKYCPSLEFQRYFAVLHAGTRTYYASLSSDFPLDTSINSLKLDCGAMLFQDGILRCVSDMARSLTYTEAGKYVYQLTEKAMLEAAIPAAKTGNTGADVYWAGVAPLIAAEDKIRELGMLPPGASIKQSYNRDIGHIFGKQEAVTLTFTKDNSQKLQAGMIAAVEYHWPYNKHATGVEDALLVTDNRGITISR